MIYPWQQQNWQQVTKSINHGVLAHALLLTGIAGLGKGDFADALADLLLCQNAKNEACGACKACKLIQAGTHPDLYIIAPEESDRAIKIDAIRNLITTVNQKAHQGGYQVVIINPADKLNLAAANALLKTLEEPPGKVVIMLVTEKPSLLPATIRSRCQRIDFKAPDVHIALEWIQQQVPKIEHDAELLLSLTQNAPLAALKLANNTQLQSRKKILDALVDLHQQKISVLQFVELCVDLDLEQTLFYLQLWYSDMVIVGVNNDAQSIVNRDYYVALNKAATTIEQSKLFLFLDKITSLLKSSNHNLQKQLQLEDILLWLFQH